MEELYEKKFLTTAKKSDEKIRMEQEKNLHQEDTDIKINKVKLAIKLFKIRIATVSEEIPPESLIK